MSHVAELAEKIEEKVEDKFDSIKEKHQERKERRKNKNNGSNDGNDNDDDDDDDIDNNYTALSAIPSSQQQRQKSLLPVDNSVLVWNKNEYTTTSNCFWRRRRSEIE